MSAVWSKDTPETRERILQFLRETHTPSEAAAGAGITPQSLRNWRKADPDFDSECDVAERQGLMPVASKIVQTALNGADEALSFQAAKFLVERRKPTRDDYAPANPNVPFGQFNLNVLAQIAPPLMQLGGQPSNTVLIEGEVERG